MDLESLDRTPSIAYNPYDYRKGHLTNFDAFVHLVKCGFGISVLAMPVGFKHAGIIPSFVTGIIVAIICVYSLNLLVRCMIVVATREQIPYARIQFAAEYTFSLGSHCTKCLAPHLSWMTSIVLSVFHLAVCTAYANFIAESSLKLLNMSEYARGSVNLPFIVKLATIAALFLINCVRNLKALSPVSTVGNIFTLGSMCIFLYFTFIPDEIGFSTDCEYFGSIRGVPLVMSIITFSIESFGVVLAVERDMINPSKFLGVFGIFYLSMTFVVAWFLFLGFIGYLKYGQRVKSRIGLFTPNNSLTEIMQSLYVMALYCTYPLQCFIPVDILWNQILVKRVKKHQLSLEIGFRFGLTLITGLVGLLTPSIDVVVNLVACVCVASLSIVLPAAMEFNLNYALFEGTWNSTMVKDMSLIIFGIFSFLVGVFTSLGRIILFDTHG